VTVTARPCPDAIIAELKRRRERTDRATTQPRFRPATGCVCRGAFAGHLALYADQASHDPVRVTLPQADIEAIRTDIEVAARPGSRR
jgi:hypothetical protein